MTVGGGQGSLPGRLAENRTYSAAGGGKASGGGSNRGGGVIPGHLRDIGKGGAEIVVSTGGATPERRIGRRIASGYGTGGVSVKFVAAEGRHFGNAGRRIYGEAVSSRLGGLSFAIG